MKRRFKSGAASFYIVAFSTLILVIIAVSFASAIVSEITRSSNDDLSQSAYDAALAGVEDAKLAFNNYWNCVKNGTTNASALSNGDAVSCNDIVYWMKNSAIDNTTHSGCDMVGHILGRIGKRESSGDGVAVTEGSDNGMDQAYTCTIIESDLLDYRATLSSENIYRVVKPEFTSGKNASNVTKVRLSWYMNSSNVGYNFNNIKDGQVAFTSLSTSATPTPPVMMLQLVQSAAGYNAETINKKADNSNPKNPKTDRAAVYLVPTGDSTLASKNAEEQNYIGAYSGGINEITALQVSETNDHSKDVPFVVYCSNNATNEFACSATIELPNPLPSGANTKRIDDTFAIVVSLPYGQPETDFSLEFLDGSGNQIKLGRTQILVDSTGRANDLYRRVEVRLEPADSTFDYPYYGIQLGSGNSSGSLSKNLVVTKEWSTNNYAGYSNW